MSERICPVPGCGAALERGHLMCRECWARVPRFIQVSVNRTWRLYSKGGFDPLKRLANYRRAAEQAVKAAEERR